MVKKEDELVGQWSTDNSGGIHLLYGSSLVLKSDGTGMLYSWGGTDNFENDEKYEYEFQIEWARIDPTKIKIKHITDPDWSVLTYQIENSPGPYNQNFDKIISLGNHAINEFIKEWFWNIPEALYRQK